MNRKGRVNGRGLECEMEENEEQEWGMKGICEGKWRGWMI